ASSCSHNTSGALQRLAILPANILIADPSSEWMRVAVPLILQEDLATSPSLIATAVNGESSAYETGASGVLRTTVETRQGRISVEAVITEMSTQQNREVIRVEGSSSNALLPSVNALAKRIDRRASDFSTKNDGALRAFTAGAQSANTE